MRSNSSAITPQSIEALATFKPSASGDSLKKITASFGADLRATALLGNAEDVSALTSGCVTNGCSTSPCPTTGILEQ